MFESFQDISRWQIIQPKLDHIEFIIHAKTFTEDRISLLTGFIYERLPKSIHIEISVGKYFVQKNEGKINPFISFL